MPSAAEQMAANLSWNSFGKAKDLQRRIFYALGLLIVYRIGTYIPVPGIDASQLRSFFEQANTGIGGMLNMFTGGAVGRMAIFALGIMPYITSSIIMQLLASMVPQLEQLKKEGEQGRKKINQYTRYGTVVLAFFQAYGISVGLESQGLASDPGWYFRASCIITLVGGTMFLMWLGEQITARGIGNGISLIIFVGIVAELPSALAQFFASGRSGIISPIVILSVILMVIIVIGLVVYLERALRKINIQYPRRQVGMKMYGGDTSNLPIKLNPSGVIPAIFASSLLLLPTTVVTFAQDDSSGLLSYVAAYLGPGQPLYYIFFGGMIIFFTYFYTLNVAFKPDEVADNLKKQGGFVPGIRPGNETSEFLDTVMSHITFPGSLYLAAVAVFPAIVVKLIGMQQGWALFYGGTSLLIMVGVAIDTIQQVNSYLLNRHYDGLMSKTSRNRRAGTI
jgi:preprotein translocase subunit SecY